MLTSIDPSTAIPIATANVTGNRRLWANDVMLGRRPAKNKYTQPASINLNDRKVNMMLRPDGVRKAKPEFSVYVPEPVDRPDRAGGSPTQWSVETTLRRVISRRSS